MDIFNSFPGTRERAQFGMFSASPEPSFNRFLGLTQAPLVSRVDLCPRTSQSRQSAHVKGIKSLACVILTNSINIAGYISLSEHLRTSISSNFHSCVGVQRISSGRKQGRH